MPTHRLFLIVTTSLLAVACAEDEPDRMVGTLTSDRVELSAEFAETITGIEVAEGARVRQGDVLLRQDARQAVARLDEAEAALQQAQARLDELLRGPRSEQISAARASLDGARQDLDFRRAEYERAQRVFDRQLASPDTLDRARAAFDAASAALEVRRAQLEELLAGTTAEELAQAEHAVSQAAARRDSVRVDVERHTIRAPVDGVLDSRLFEVGERPGIGQPVLVLLAGEQPHARVYVPENRRVTVAPGTAARIHVDGLDAAIEGRVRWVASESAFTPYFALTERDRGRLTFVAKVDITESRDRLPDGVPVEVELLVDDTR